jgi:hypothetical protein
LHRRTSYGGPTSAGVGLVLRLVLRLVAGLVPSHVVDPVRGVTTTSARRMRIVRRSFP